MRLIFSKAYLYTVPSRQGDSLAIIHEDHVRVNFDRELNGFLFTHIQDAGFGRYGPRTLSHFCPARQAGNPALDHRRRSRPPQFVPHRDRKDYSLEERRQHIDMADQNEVVDRPSVGNDDLQVSAFWRQL